MAPRRDYIDELKGLGILLVVFGHFMEQYRMNYPFVSATFFCIYAFHMALFCACSGLVARFNPRKLVTQQLWLYFLGQSLMLVFRAVVLREDFAESGGVLAALLLPWRHMWYLYALIFWHLTLPLLCLLRDRLGLAGSCLGMSLAVAVGLAGGLIDWPFMLVRVFAFFPFYAFGVLFRPQLDTPKCVKSISPPLPHKTVLHGCCLQQVWRSATASTLSGSFARRRSWTTVPSCSTM